MEKTKDKFDLTTNCGKLPKEFDLSENGEVLLDYDSLIPIKQFDKNGEGFGIFYSQENVKEFIKRLKGKLENASIGYFGKVPIFQVINEIDELAGEKLI